MADTNQEMVATTKPPEDPSSPKAAMEWLAQPHLHLTCICVRMPSHLDSIYQMPTIQVDNRDTKEKQAVEKRKTA